MSTGSAFTGALVSDLLSRGVAAEVVAEITDRLDVYGPDLVAALEEAYPVAEPGDDSLLTSLSSLMANAIADRPVALRARDRKRLLEPDRLQRPDMIGYATYVDRFGGTLSGVGQHIDHLQRLGVTYLHLLPLLKTRPGPDDGGYAVADYREVRPNLGTMEDLEQLASDLHDAGIDLTIDLVLNHVAQEHPWAEAARAGDPHYLDYFYVFADRGIPDEFERTLPEVFPAFAPGNFTYCDDLEAWVWTTFNSWQWDVNWTNPSVFCEYVEIMLSLANRGVDCLRLDAIAFIVKQLGTSCQNLSGVHVLTQAMRSILRIVAPSVSLKAEAIVAPDDLVAYLGQGRFSGKVSDLAYHNSLMVQIWSALAAQDARLMSIALQRFPPIPITASWVTYLRCHDDIGWAIDDGDAAAVGWSGPAHRAFLADYYRGDFSSSTAQGADFQDNPLTGDRRTSGSAASLTGIHTAVDAADLHALRLSVHRLLLGYAMVFGFGGIPLIWMGDEIALPNDEDYLDDPRHADDNRWMHRPRMDWPLVARCVREEASLDEPAEWAAQQTLRGMELLARARARLPMLHAACTTQVDVLHDPAVVLFTRRSAAGTLVEVYNVADSPRRLSLDHLRSRGVSEPRDTLGLHETRIHEGDLLLAPYAAHWWVTAADVPSDAPTPTLGA